MAGIRIAPSAAASATADPDISAKNIEVPIDTMARPPRIHPSIAEANAIRRLEMPEAFMIAPERMNRGIAISGKLVAPLYKVIATFGSVAVPWVTSNATTATTPSATAMGMSISTSARTEANRSSICIGLWSERLSEGVPQDCLRQPTRGRGRPSA